MASTLTPAMALDIARQNVKYMPLERDGLAVRILDDINKIMWMAAPWRWTMGSMPEVTLEAAKQDYLITKPTDFLYLAQVKVYDGVTNTPIEIVSALPTNVNTVGPITQVALYQNPANSNNYYRVSPNPPAIPAGKTLKLYGLYKKQAPVIEESNMADAGVLVFDDEWFWVYVEGVLWRAFLYSNYQQSGSVTYSNGVAQYSGQAASFFAGLDFMRLREPLPLLDDRLSPQPKLRDK